MRRVSRAQNASEARALIVDVLKPKQLKKDNKGANFLINCCAKGSISLDRGGSRFESRIKTQELTSNWTPSKLVIKIRNFIGNK